GSAYHNFHLPHSIDRDSLLLPDVMLEDYNTPPARDANASISRAALRSQVTGQKPDSEDLTSGQMSGRKRQNTLILFHCWPTELPCVGVKWSAAVHRLAKLFARRGD
ncbi:MAG: hypothetical protein ABSE48_08295, partial [Verrucomicrobiota bacterium]